MTTPPPPDIERKRRQDAIHEALKEGYAPPKVGGGKGAAAVITARRLGMQHQSFYSWIQTEELRKARGEKHFHPDWSLYVPPGHVAPVYDEPVFQETGPEYKLTFTVRQQRPTEYRRLRGLCIGDTHSSPNIDGDRFLWIGRHAHETQPDFMLQIGDLLTLDSLCRFDGNETVIGRLKPSFEQDIEAGHRDLQLLDSGLQGFEPQEKHCTLGNHEERCISFTNRNPEVWGVLTGMLDNLFMSHGWTYSPFGQVYFFGGVGAVHCPLNRLGKPYGGKTALNLIANDALHDIIFGHRHVGGSWKAPKIGTNQSITVLDLGSALPQGHVEPYVGHAMSGWSYGVYDVLIDEGHIQSFKHHSMSELEERYA